MTDDLLCVFCQKECQNKNSLSNHQRLCKINPNRDEPSRGMLGKRGLANQYTKANANGVKCVVSAETKRKISEAGKNRTWSLNHRANHKLAMKKAVADNPESYTSSNRGRVKQIEYHGLKLHGKWELEFYKFCEDKKIDCERCLEGFKYFWNGERLYFPDFYLPTYDMYVEVKGFKTDRDDAKWKQFPKKLITIMDDEISAIRRHEFTLLGC